MAQYTTIEELQELVRQLNSAATQETDNYHALCVQCQDLIAKIEEHSSITNKYGEWFASMYRDMLPTVPGEKNSVLQSHQTINDVIDFIEDAAEQQAEAKAKELEFGISNLEDTIAKKRKELQEIESALAAKKSELKSCEDELKQAQIEVCYVQDELSKDTQRKIERPISTLNRKKQFTPQANPVSDNIKNNPEKKAEMPSLPKNPQENTPVIATEHYTSTRHIIDTSGIIHKKVNGFMMPETPEKGHLYLCDDTGFIDVTLLPEIRRNNLMMLNATKYQATGKPQFKIEVESGKFYIIEQQQVSNLINGKELRGKQEIRNADEIIIKDLKGQLFKLVFCIS